MREVSFSGYPISTRSVQIDFSLSTANWNFLFFLPFKGRLKEFRPPPLAILIQALIDKTWRLFDSHNAGQPLQLKGDQNQDKRSGCLSLSELSIGWWDWFNRIELDRVWQWCWWLSASSTSPSSLAALFHRIIKLAHNNNMIVCNHHRDDKISGVRYSTAGWWWRGRINRWRGHIPCGCGSLKKRIQRIHSQQQ